MSQSSSSSDGYDIAFKVLLGVFAVAIPLSHLAWLGGNLTALLTGHPWAWPTGPPTPSSVPTSSGPAWGKRPCSSVPESSPYSP